MHRYWLARLGVLAAAAVLAFGPATAAWADTEIGINQGNVPTTAADFENHSCDPNQGGGPFPGKDVWVFVLPGNPETSGDFVSVTAVFGANGSLTIPADGGGIVTDKGTSKAWITTPVGWTLTGASAVITGTADKFNLTHTCPGRGGVKPSGAPDTGGGGGSTGGGMALGIGALTLAGAGGLGLALARRRRRAA